MDLWDDEFCERLASGGRSHRLRPSRHRGVDVVTGRCVRRSAPTTCTPTQWPSSSASPTEGLTSRDVHGRRPGTADRPRGPKLVSTLTLLSTTALAPEDFDGPELPSSARRMRRPFASPSARAGLEYREAVVEYLLDDLRVFSGRDGGTRLVPAPRSSGPTTAPATWRPARTTAILEGGPDPWRDRLGTITAPTLVIHGTDDLTPAPPAR